MSRPSNVKEKKPSADLIMIQEAVRGIIMLEPGTPSLIPNMVIIILIDNSI